MTYVVPTPPDIRASFPEFTGVSDGVIQMALDEAGLAVDQTWPENAFNLAYKLYTAHLLRMGGNGTSAQAQAVVSSPAGLKMRKAGDTVEEFFAGPTSSGGAVSTDAWLSATDYGQRFIGLRQRYFGGPRVLAPPLTFPSRNVFGFPFD